MFFYLAVIFLASMAGGILFLVVYAIHSVIQEYRRDRIPSLLYHRLLPKARVDSGELIDRDRTYVCYDTAFDEQMAYLYREGYTTILLNDFLAFQEGKRMLPPSPIILTFDDGFESNYLYAFPILKKYGMKATIFVTPDRESENFKKYSSTDAPLKHEQMKEMRDYGIAIESHGMTHRYLTELDAEVVRWELEESRKTLERIVGNPVQFLAVPSGAYDRTVRELAKQSGYRAVFCMLKGSNNASSDRYALRRVVIGREFSLGDFQRVLEPATTCQLRYASLLQNLLLKMLGPCRLDTFRDFLNSTGLGSFLGPGRLKFFLAGLTLVLCVVTILAFMAIFREFNL